MPFLNEHSARILNPDKFQQDSFRRQNIDPGVDIVIGKKIGQDSMSTQTYRFDSDKFTVEQAKKWLQDNDITDYTFEEAKALYNMLTVNIEGMIGTPENDDDKNKYFSYSDLLLAVSKSSEYQSIELVINSNGGYVDVADDMIALLKSLKKPISARNSGNICSAASKIFTLAPKENRFFDPFKGQFLIHNPWAKIEGDSNTLASISSKLQEIENDYAKWYSEKTGSDINVIRGFMKQNAPLTVEQIETLGFAICANKQIPINACAKLKIHNNMENKEVIERLSSFEKMLNSIMSMFKPKALMLSDTNGTELEFSDIKDVSELKTGTKVTQGGSPANGEYMMPDGSTLVCESGTVKEIKQPQSEDETSALKAEIEALKAENLQLKGEKEKAEASISNVSSEFNKISAEYAKIKAMFSDGNPINATPPHSESKKYLSKSELEKMLN